MRRGTHRALLYKRPAAAAGGGAAAWTPNATALYNPVGYGSSSTSFNLTQTTAATDTVVVFIGNTNGVITGVTCGGNAMTMAAESSAGQPQCSIYYIIGAYTNPTVVVTCGAAIQHAGCAYGKWTGASATPSGTTAVKAFGFGGAPHTLGSLTVPSGGVLLAAALAINDINQAWPNTTEFAEIDSGSSFNISAASHASAGAIAVQITNGDIAAAAITIGP
jgi:hypothetical protein